MRVPTSSRIILALAVLAAAPMQAQHIHPPLHVDPTLDDCSVIFASNLTQSAYRQFVREFGSVSAFKQASASQTLGKGRVMVGIELMKFTVEEYAPAWHDTFAHPNADHPLGANKEFPKFKVRAGVTDNLDVGAFYAANPLANYGWVGIDGKYLVLSERQDAPVNLAVRVAYTQTLYVDDMDMHAATADISIDRQFRQIFRPYLGLGADAVHATENSPVVNLDAEAAVIPHLFGGVEVNVFRRMTVGAEFTVGARNSLQIQVGGLVF